MIDLVKFNGDKAVTDSKTVAKVFGKEHKKVLRDIEALQIPDDWRGANFGPSHFERTTPTGGKYLDKAYTITRDGFTILAMGYTGAKAMKFKLAYIDAFNRMEAALRGQDPAETLRIITADLGPKWVLERLQTADVLERFYAPRTQLGEVSASGEEHATIRRAANPVKGGHRPTPRERAFIQQPSLFGWTVLRQIGKKSQEA